MHYRFDTMGTVASISIAGGTANAAAADRVLEELWTICADIDARFSLYDPASEASKIARGELRLMDASLAMRDAYAEAVRWRRETDGAFTPHRRDGVIDLAGTVKASAIQACGGALTAAGFEHWLVNIGGDVLSAGMPGEGRAWQAGIVDPADRTTHFGAVSLTPGRGAIATSGTTERGEHVWRLDDAADDPVVQASVWGNDIVAVDVLATAVLAAGTGVIDEYAERFDVEILAMTASGAILATRRFREELTTTVS